MVRNLTTKLAGTLGALAAVTATVSSLALGPPPAAAATTAEAEVECVGSFGEDFARNVVTSYSPNCRHRPRALCESPDGPDAPFGEVAWFTTPTFNPPGVPSDSLGGVSIACPSFLPDSGFRDYVLVEGAVELEPAT